MKLTRRTLLATTLLPRVAIAQADQRPSVTVAVQKIANTGVLEPLREQSSNVSERWVASILETPIARNQQGKLERVPGIASAWRRISPTTVELSLRPDVRFHNGDVLTAEDVAFSYGAHMFAANLPADIPQIAKRHFPALERVEIVDARTVRIVNKTPDLTLEGRLSAGGREIVSQRSWMERGDWAAMPNRLAAQARIA
jgi:peptide/nickel transport system substrate-binding protein